MPALERSPRLARFEDFELDLRAGELRPNGGGAIRLGEQPLQILVALLESPGEVVLREELRKRLWPNDTIVEFEHSINAAMNRLRQALGDSADKPRFIETLARRGYRWMIPVEWIDLRKKRTLTTAAVARTEGNRQSLIGKKVSHYRILEVLGGGGMGVVYKAEDLKLGRCVAVKFLGEELISDHHALERFEREARTISALDHANICTIHEVEEHEGQPFIVMQLLQGHTLRQRIESAGTEQPAFSQIELLDFGIQIVTGLEAAHHKGILHRDIKPANIFITDRGEIKLLDFGLAKLMDTGIVSTEVTRQQSELTPKDVSLAGASQATMTLTGAMMGTASYMSPEQVRKDHLDGRSDLFSFGVVFYEMATGHQPFRGDDLQAINDAILHSTPASLAVWNPNLPVGLQGIIDKALAKDREKRYQSAGEIISELRRVQLAVREREARDQINTTPRPQFSSSQSRTRSWSKLVSGVAAGLGLFVLAGFFVRIKLWPPPIPKVVDTAQLTKDGGTKDVTLRLLSDGMRLYFQEGAYAGPESTVFPLFAKRPALVQVSTQGGETAETPISLTDSLVFDISPARSELLLGGPVSKTGTPSPRELWIMSLPAGPLRRVGNILALDASWSPDGNHVVFVDGKEIFVANPDGSEIRRLATVPEIPYWVRFSPDGTRLRFTVFTLSGRPEDWNLMEMAADGSGLHHLPIHGCCGKWSADGKYYFYQTSRDIWVLPERRTFWGRAELGVPAQLTTGPIKFGAATPSADGKHLFVIGDDRRIELVKYDRKSKQLVPFLGGISAGELEVSRDGQWVVYTTFPASNLWRSKLDGSERLQLTFPPVNAHEPRWSPDGKQILFTDNPRRMFVVPADGGSLKQVMPKVEDPNTEVGAGFWMPDGNSIVFVMCSEKSPCATYQLNLKTQEVSKIPGSDGLAAARVSPDGRYMTAYRPSRTMLYDFQSQQWSEFADGVFTWSRDSKSVYSHRKNGDQSGEVVRISVPDGKVEQVLDLKDITLGGYWPGWISLLPDDSPLLMINKSKQEIYRFDLQYR